ncbi:MAG: UvrB/UvrC motif-containing protein [Elusimicrobiota bacterium]
MKDDKSYPFVKITLEEEFPRFRVVRKKRKDGGAYFGPYPQVSSIRRLLRTLWKRRLFPLRACDYSFSSEKPLAQKKIKSCLYYHTAECPAPCAGRISSEDYRAIAKNAVLFFSGRTRHLKKRFTGEMSAASAALDYERAALLRDNLAALEHMSERVRFQEVRPPKVAQRLDASRGVSALQSALGLSRPPHHVECFDVAHLFGRSSAASMVCFLGGEPNKGHYRRFKIRTVAGIDDFASIAEAVSRRYRRLKDEGAPMPDLVLIDGGKGQLSAAQKALESVKVRLPLAALAKREEEVFQPDASKPLQLDRGSPALRLLQRLRDEAHRFAVTYHRSLRGKVLLGDE